MYDAVQCIHPEESVYFRRDDALYGDAPV
ncbi:MAG: hypothetical protein ACJAXE_002489 [Neolewinella sp.]